MEDITSLEYWNNYERKNGESYEKDAKIFEYSAPEKIVEMVINYFSLNDPVLDVGMGTGLVGELLIEKGFIVDGVDFSEGMIKNAVKKGYRNIINKDIRESFIGYNKYKSIISVGVYGDFVELGHIKNIIKILGSNGKIAIAGSSEVLELSLTKILEKEKLKIIEEKIGVGVGNLLADISAKMERVPCLSENYMYVIAVKN